MNFNKTIRIVLGIMFLMTGLMKITISFFGNAFLIQLTEAKIPLPYFNFWFVPFLEIGIGLMLLFNYKSFIALLFIIPIILVAFYVHLVVSNPNAFPAQPQFPVMPIIVLAMVTFLLIKHFKETVKNN